MRTTGAEPTLMCTSDASRVTAYRRISSRFSNPGPTFSEPIRPPASARPAPEVEAGIGRAAGPAVQRGPVPELTGRGHDPAARARPRWPVPGAARTPARVPTVAATESRRAFEVVTTLEEHDQAPGSGCERRDPGRQIGEIARREVEPGERIGAMGVEPGRNQHPGGREVLDRRRHHGVERVEVDVAGRARGEREVERRAHTGADAGLVEPSGARIQRPLVQRDVEHIGRRLEDLLRAVAVVRVPVDDEHPLAPGHQRGRGDRDVVEQAEAHRVGGHRVVAGRPDREERAVRDARVERLDRGEPGAGGTDRGVEGALADRGVGVERAPAVRAHAFERVEVGGRVHPLELGPRRRPPVEDGAIETDEVEAGEHRVEPGRTLGVAASGVVLGEQRVGRDEHHGAEGSGRSAGCERPCDTADGTLAVR